MGGVLCPVLCGRDDELRALRDAFAGAVAGQGGVAFITGEPGIGKSRLVRELAGHARGLGALTATGRAVPAGSGTPYRPLTEALLQLLRDRPLTADAGLDPWLPALRAVLPGLGQPDQAGEPLVVIDFTGPAQLTGGGSRVACHGCGVEFRVGQGAGLDHLIAAVQQHASGSHGHDLTRDHILSELQPG